MHPDPTEITTRLTPSFVQRIRQAALAVVRREIGCEIEPRQPPMLTQDEDPCP